MFVVYMSDGGIEYRSKVSYMYQSRRFLKSGNFGINYEPLSCETSVHFAKRQTLGNKKYKDRL